MGTSNSTHGRDVSEGVPVEDSAADIELITRSPTRVRILEQLAENGEMHRDGLKAATDVSRTTLHRNVRALVDEGWVENSGVTYSITPCGEWLIGEVLQLLETAGVAHRLRDAVRWIPLSEMDLDLRELRTARVWVSESGDPYSMVDRHVRTIRRMDSCRALLRVTGLHATEAARDAILDRGASAAFVATPAVAETLTEKPEYASLTREMVQSGRFDLFVAESDLTFSLAIVDDTVQLLADEDGHPRALLESDARSVVSWAEEVFEAQKAAAR